MKPLNKFTPEQLRSVYITPPKLSADEAIDIATSLAFSIRNGGMSDETKESAMRLVNEFMRAAMNATKTLDD